MTDLSTAILRVLVAHREQYPLVTGGLAPCVTCRTPYPCAVAEALKPIRALLTGGYDDEFLEAALIDANTRKIIVASPHPFTPDPVKPLCTHCDEPEAFHRG